MNQLSLSLIQNHHTVVNPTPSDVQTKANELASDLFKVITLSLLIPNAPRDAQDNLTLVAQSYLKNPIAEFESVDEATRQAVMLRLESLGSDPGSVVSASNIVRSDASQLATMLSALFKTLPLTQRVASIITTVFVSYGKCLQRHLMNSLKENQANDDPLFSEKARAVIKHSLSCGIALLSQALQSGQEARVADIGDLVAEHHSLEAVAQYAVKQLEVADHDSHETWALAHYFLKRHPVAHQNFTEHVLKKGPSEDLLLLCGEGHGAYCAKAFLILYSSEAFKARLLELLYEQHTVRSDIFKHLDDSYLTLKTTIVQNLLKRATEILGDLQPKLAEAFYPNQHTQRAVAEALQRLEAIPAGSVTDFVSIENSITGILDLLDNAAGQQQATKLLSNDDFSAAVNALYVLTCVPNLMPQLLSRSTSADAPLFANSEWTLKVSDYVELLSTGHTLLEHLEAIQDPPQIKNSNMVKFASTYLLEGLPNDFQEFTAAGLRDSPALNLFEGLVQACRGLLKWPRMDVVRDLLYTAKPWTAWIDAVWRDEGYTVPVQLGLKQVEVQIRDLGPGASLLIPVGWLTEKDGHAMHVLLSRLSTKEQRFRLDVIDPSSAIAWRDGEAPFSWHTRCHLSYPVTDLSLDRVLRHLNSLLPLVLKPEVIAQAKPQTSSPRAVSSLSLDEDLTGEQDTRLRLKHYDMLGKFVDEGNARLEASPGTKKAQRGQASCAIESLNQVCQLVLGNSVYKEFKLVAKLLIYVKYSRMMGTDSRELRLAAKREVAKTVLKRILQRVIQKGKPDVAAKIMMQVINKMKWLSSSLVEQLIRRLVEVNAENSLITLLRCLTEQNAIWGIDAARLASRLGSKKAARQMGEIFADKLLTLISAPSKIKMRNMLKRLMSQAPHYLNIEGVWDDLGKAQPQLAKQWIEFCHKLDLPKSAQILSAGLAPANPLDIAAMDTTDG